MPAFPHSVRIFVAVAPVDMRKSFNGLWTAASEQLHEDSKSGAVFCFINKERTRLKLLYWDGTGVWLAQENDLLHQEIAVLRTQIAWLQQQLFGPGKSEKLDRAQLLLKLGELEKLVAAVAPKQTITYERTTARENRPLPAENFAKLPVQETIEIVPEVVQAEPAAYEKIGEERSFEVDVVSPKLFKREIVRPKFKRRSSPPRAGPRPGTDVIALGRHLAAQLDGRRDRAHRTVAGADLPADEVRAARERLCAGRRDTDPT